MGTLERQTHYRVICEVLSKLNAMTDRYILKGGTSLMLCYGLTRFSEDIDLDANGVKAGITPVLDSLGYPYRVAKDTATVKRYKIHYDGCSSLKVEISYRRGSIPDYEHYRHGNGIVVYKLPYLAVMKAQAYCSRDRLRDLYDLAFICLNYWGMLDGVTQATVVGALSYRGLENYDYLCQTQDDEFIDKEILGDMVLQVFYNLNLS